ncbi:MAG: hypothetical protein ACI87Q_002535, partial [Pseudohongiellaceae bacterium]
MPWLMLNPTVIISTLNFFDKQAYISLFSDALTFYIDSLAGRNNNNEIDSAFG